MERRAIAVHDEPFTLREANRDLGPGLRATVSGGRHRQFRAQLYLKLERDNLAQARRTAIVQHGVAAGLELQAVQRGLEREPPPVHRGSEREYGGFQFPPCGAETIHLLADPWCPVHGAFVMTYPA